MLFSENGLELGKIACFLVARVSRKTVYELQGIIDRRNCGAERIFWERDLGEKLKEYHQLKNKNAFSQETQMDRLKRGKDFLLFFSPCASLISPVEMVWNAPGLHRGEKRKSVEQRS